MRVLFTTVGLSGHFFPLVPLAWACRAAGHEVLVATAEHFVPAVVRTGLPTVPCGPSADFVALGAADAVSDSLSRRRLAHGRLFGRIAASGLDGTSALVRSWGPDVVVSERAEFAGPVAAAAHGVARVELRWGVAPLTEYRAGAAAVLGQLPEPDLVLDPWPPSLRLTHARTHRSLRHVSYNGDARVPDWTLRPRSRPRVCLTLGTVVPRLGAASVQNLVVPTLERLAGYGFELVVAVAENIAAMWPPLPDAVRHVGYVPLAPAVAACDALIHHGGQGTSLTALEVGCPQVILPQFDDQLDNADAVVRAGAGLRLPLADLTPAAVADTCAKLLATPAHGIAARVVAAEIHEQPSPVRVVSDLAALVARTTHDKVA
ncbi:UDP:flavonoid glycosyltransferase YjiC, YdhE family [Amycolatopsis marina]|uniref:UDP:flavonoid glycosyltransferase YjiC, YdhE family n=1 Tax=Amycolatopsis marina TaxID=490629 RepID=A0A1I0ZKT2_9PSEU|nr:nucleotide disphospho-sugar-binding domain-containing protein [Amycolatopsis marina]SFB26111.1 UDP:flavonoid glycosyltransferase YjiC, YdhE family [Amycolatopsis marina]